MTYEKQVIYYKKVGQLELKTQKADTRENVIDDGIHSKVPLAAAGMGPQRLHLQMVTTYVPIRLYLSATF